MPKTSFPNKQVWVKDVGRYSQEPNFHHKDRKRVTFKSNKHGPKRDGKEWGTAIREYLLDEDVDMGATAGSSRSVQTQRKFNKNRRGKNSGPVVNYNARRPLMEGPNNWYKVQLPHGDKYDKSYILKMLTDALAPQTFWPIAWNVNGTAVTFYVDEYKIADKLNNLDRQLHLPNGFKLHMRVYPGFPNVDVNQTLKQKMKLVMAKRYNAVNKSLDLSKFHADPDLQEYFCVLFKPIVFLAVLDIIAENIPELEAINLYDNRISTFNSLKKVQSKIPNVKILHIGKNNIRDMSQLDSLQGLHIVELVLDGNPLCDKFKDQATYISEVRKRFPKCMKLDGIDLPPPISFDITEEHHLPSPQQTLLCNPDGSAIVRQFLEQYIQIFDTENRQPLIQAYHEHAVYSMTMTYPYGYGREEKTVPWLNWYATDNRNILRVQNPDRRLKLLKQGNLEVVSFLKDMPQTKHDIHSFTVDLTIFTPQMLTLTVSGMFKELKSGHKIPPLRFFFKTLVIVPAGSGFCICNEEVHITNATPQQAKEAFKTPIVLPSAPITPAPSTSTVGSPSAVPVSVPVPNVPDDVTKQEMVKQMAAQSGMNLEWSLKCLEETQWDFQTALTAFQNLHSQGIVPPEAFVK